MKCTRLHFHLASSCTVTAHPRWLQTTKTDGDYGGFAACSTAFSIVTYIELSPLHLTEIIKGTRGSEKTWFKSLYGYYEVLRSPDTFNPPLRLPSAQRTLNRAERWETRSVCLFLARVRQARCAE